MNRPRFSTLATITRKSADPERVRHFLALLESAGAGPVLNKLSKEESRILVAVLSGSLALGRYLAAQPERLKLLKPEELNYPRRKQGLLAEVNELLEPARSAGDFVSALKILRELKQRQMLRIGARDLARLGETNEIIGEISAVADVCLDATWQICRAQLVRRHGCPYHQDASGNWQPTRACVLGLGKLGGQELNYSSDVDVIFIYDEEGSVFSQPPSKKKLPRPTMTSHQFYNRLAEMFVAEVSRMAPEGMMYRIDLRLRPEGDPGPLTRSLSSYENYYAQWGQTWERMMLIKGRRVAGDESVAAEFLEMIQPFRYPRSLDKGVLREIGAMKDRIENEVVKAGEMERNVKLGFGGIREIEFIAQAMQLRYAGRQPFLQGTQTLPAMEKLVEYQHLPREDARTLAGAYCFLRDVEHRLQMEDDRQTHTIPAARPAQERLARLMGCDSLKAFQSKYRAETTAVRNIFDRIFKSENDDSQPGSVFPKQFDGKENEWRDLLAAHAFKDVDKAFRVLREFVEGPGFGHVSTRTRELAMGLVPKLFRLCPGSPGFAAGIKNHSKETQDPAASVSRPPLSDPDRVVTRLDSFIAAYGARATLFEVWNSNPGLFELLVLLFDRSEFLAELAIRNPDLVDELVTSGRLRQRKTAEETLADLRHGLADADQHLWMRRYHQAELMRIGLRDILGLADFEQYLVELSALADACLQYAMEVVMRKNKLKRAPFVVIGLGKLGGFEIDYGSDLDLLFVADARAKHCARLAPMALAVMDLLSSRTDQGLLFHTDARLRPDGEKGLLVNTITAYEEYYRQRAMLWEIQSLSRARAVAGDPKAGAEFEKLAGALGNFAKPSLPLSAFSPDWKKKIFQMRTRIEKERTPAGQEELAIKTGKGGLMDAEFVAQTLCLENGWREPNTLRALELGRQSGKLVEAEKLIENYRLLRRVEAILRRWSYEGEVLLPADPAPYYRVSIRCGFSDVEQFRRTLRDCRNAIREVYTRVFSA